MTDVTLLSDEQCMNDVLVPERSVVQRMDALREANRVRTYRAVVKQELKRGERSITELVEDPPAEMATMKVFDLMLAQPKLGRVMTRTILARHHISPSKTLGGLSQRQRLVLVLALARYNRLTTADSVRAA